MIYKKDLTGEQFGEWKVLGYAFKGYNGISYFNCRCSCGIEKAVARNNLTSGDSTSCGHNSNKDQLIDLAGFKFGELTVLEYIKDKKKWLCQCSCGNTTLKRSWDLRNGKGITCGTRENHTSKKMINLKNKTFGELTVIEYAGDRNWICRCSCGRLIETQGSRLRNGSKISCGHTLNQVKRNDLTGKKFGKLKVIKYINYQQYTCLCECGNTRIVRANELSSNKVTMCCKCTEEKIQREYEANTIDISGQRFGELVAIRPNRSNHKWICRCDCGNEIEIRSQYLRRGDYKSCGHNRCKNYSDKELRELINTLENILERKPYVYDIMNYTGYKTSTPIYNFLNRNRDININRKIVGSILEEKVLDILYKCGISEKDIVHQHKTTDNTEIDIYIPKLNIGIEVNGSYWHSDIFKSDFENRNKIISAYKDSIKLYIIYDFEIESNYEYIKELLWDIIQGTNKNINDYDIKCIDLAKCTLNINLNSVEWLEPVFKYVKHNGSRLLTEKELLDINEVDKANRISISSLIKLKR